MGYEIDFLPVGDGSKGGDAIALRYGSLTGPRSGQTVVIIDGGYSDDGKALVEHVKRHYGTTEVDVVVSTHPDRDHIAGLEVVLSQLDVKYLFMHQPWKHSLEFAAARKFGFSKARLSEKLEKSLQELSELESIALSRGIEIYEPFTGLGLANRDSQFRIIGPSVDYYDSLLPEIQSPATAKKASGPYDFLFKATQAARKLLTESLTKETLRDDGETKASNNSSAICLLEEAGRKCLFTADAGIPALEQAVAVLEAEGFQPGSLAFCQIPHHGSRRNVGPSVLNRLLGSKARSEPHATAFVSAPPDNPDHVHPAKKVTNAFRRRGYQVHATQGSTKRHSFQAPPRPGWQKSEPIAFHSQVEEDSES
jgi:beta-lactamase superfamily II metal-dependent hydrolase